MPLFTAVGAFLFGAGTFLAATTAFVLQFAAGVGLSFLARAIAGEKKQEPVGIQGKMSAGGDVPRCLIFGRYNTAGSLVYRGTYGYSGDTPNAFYAEVRALCDMPTKGLLEVWVDGEKVSLISGTYGLASTSHIRYGTKFGDVQNLWFRFYDGTQTTADSQLVANLSGNARPYGPERVGRGITYVVITAQITDLDNENPIFTGFPQCKFTVDGMRLYDPSRDSSVGGSGSQRWDNPATWGGDGDDLPAVQIYNILRGIYWNGQWVYGLQTANPAILPAADWIAAINKCRQQVYGPNGLEPQYRSAAQINVDTQPLDAIEALCKSCAGRLSEIGGVYKLHVGEPGEAALSFSDDDVLSSEEQLHSQFHGISDSINGVVAKYPEPVEGWNVKTSPPMYRPDLEVIDGNRRLLADVDLATVPYHGQVQRLIKSALAEARRERTHTITLPPWAQILEPGDIVAWTSVRNGYDEKLFRVEGLTYKANLDVLVQLVEVDPSDYDWDQDEDYVPPVFSPMEILRPAPQPIIAWYAEGQVVLDAQGLPRRPVIYLSWDGSKTNIQGVAYEIATDSAGSNVILRDRTDNAEAGAIIVSSQAFIPGDTYYARGRYIPDAPRDTPWSSWLPAILPDVRWDLIDLVDRLQHQLTTLHNKNDDRISDIEQLVASIAANQDARNWNDKQDVKTELKSVSGTLSASVSQVMTVATSNKEALAAYKVEVNSALYASGYANLTEAFTTIATTDGKLAATWQMQSDVNGHISSMTSYNDGTVSSIVFVATEFKFSLPGVAGGAPQDFITAGTLDGVPTFGISGNFLLDGVLTARMMNVGTLSAITANIGEVTAGIIRSANNRMRILLDDGRFELWDTT